MLIKYKIRLRPDLVLAGKLPGILEEKRLVKNHLKVLLC